MNDTEIAWAAGFFDGEGSTSEDRVNGKIVVLPSAKWRPPARRA